MLGSAVKSKPVYSPLMADLSGRFHLLIGQAEGAVAVRRVLAELAAATPSLTQRTRILFLPAAQGSQAGWELPGAASVELFEQTTDLLAACHALLDQARMGLRLYVAGPESFIGRALQLALTFNLNKDEIRAEELGSKARRVHCVHCRTIAEDVRTNIVRCSQCARWLAVRDHYSRRLAAYMGVMADAEVPGELPAVCEIYR